MEIIAFEHGGILLLHMENDIDHCIHSNIYILATTMTTGQVVGRRVVAAAVVCYCLVIMIICYSSLILLKEKCTEHRETESQSTSWERETQPYLEKMMVWVLESSWVAGIIFFFSFFCLRHNKCTLPSDRRMVRRKKINFSKMFILFICVHNVFDFPFGSLAAIGRRFCFSYTEICSIFINNMRRQTILWKWTICFVWPVGATQYLLCTSHGCFFSTRLCIF